MVLFVNSLMQLNYFDNRTDRNLKQYHYLTSHTLTKPIYSRCKVIDMRVLSNRHIEWNRKKYLNICAATNRKATVHIKLRNNSLHYAF